MEVASTAVLDEEYKEQTSGTTLSYTYPTKMLYEGEDEEISNTFGSDNQDTSSTRLNLLQFKREIALEIQKNISPLIKKIEDLSTRMEHFEKLQNQSEYKPFHIPDKEAEKLIRNHLYHLKKEGINKVNMIELIFEYNLPPDQIEDIMKKLSEEGVKEIE
ncbi:MAG: hypothetical protein JSW28_03580 [Thermoplasmata archaeon]|nr:MAG: hypothetical protein JSW28_03580 [Thermoplasmata archaeon]